MPHSTYSKIFDVLTLLEQEGEKDIFDFSKQIHDTKMESFAIWRRVSGEVRPVKEYCSPESIRRVIRFMEKIELVEIINNRTCKIRPAGSNALVEENYPIQLSTLETKSP